MAVGVVVGTVVSADWSDKGVIVVAEKALSVANARNRFSSRYEAVFTAERHREEIAAFADRAVERAAKGYNAAVALYGPTSSGKTSLLIGKTALEREKSLCWQCSESLFTRIQAEKRDFAVTLSALLVYKEKIYDLLHPQGLSAPLTVKDSAESGLLVSGLAAFPVCSAEEAFPLLTNAIEQISASPYPHSASSLLFRYHLTSQSASQTGLFRSISLDLWEIAGSEHIYKGEKAADKHSLHLSVTHLSKAFSALANTGKMTVSLFRGATVPRLMQNVVIGGFPCFLVTVSPANDHIEETIYALKFADTAKKVPLRLQKSRISVDNLAFVRFLQKEVETLREFLTSNGQEIAWEDPFASIGQCLSVPELETLIKQRTNLLQTLMKHGEICQFADNTKEEDLSSTQNMRNSAMTTAFTAPVSRLGTAAYTSATRPLQTAFSPSSLLAELEMELSTCSMPAFQGYSDRGNCSSSAVQTRGISQSPVSAIEKSERDGAMPPPSTTFSAAFRRPMQPRLISTSIPSFDQQLIQQKVRRDNVRNEALSLHHRALSAFRQGDDMNQSQDDMNQSQSDMQDLIDIGLKRMQEERVLHQSQLDQRLEREKQETLSLRKKLNRRPKIEPRGVQSKGSAIDQLLDL